MVVIVLLLLSSEMSILLELLHLIALICGHRPRVGAMRERLNRLNAPIGRSQRLRHQTGARRRANARPTVLVHGAGVLAVVRLLAVGLSSHQTAIRPTGLRRAARVLAGEVRVANATVSLLVQRLRRQTVTGALRLFAGLRCIRRRLLLIELVLGVGVGSVGRVLVVVLLVLVQLLHLLVVLMLLLHAPF